MRKVFNASRRIQRWSRSYAKKQVTSKPSIMPDPRPPNANTVTAPYRGRIGADLGGPRSRFYRLTTPGVALMKCPNSSATLRALGQPWAPGPGCGTGSFGNSWVRRPSTSAVGCVEVGNSREHNVRRITETRKKNEFFRRSAVYRLRGAVHSLRGQLHRPGI